MCHEHAKTIRDYTTHGELVTYAAAYYLGVALSVVAVGDSRVFCPKAAATLLGFEPKGEPATTCTMINRVAAPRHWNLAVQLSCDWGASKVSHFSSHGCLPRASGLLQQATLLVVTRHPGGPLPRKFTRKSCPPASRFINKDAGPKSAAGNHARTNTLLSQSDRPLRLVHAHQAHGKLDRLKASV